MATEFSGQLNCTYGQHIVALLVDLVVLFLDVELPEEVERNYCIYVYDYNQQHYCQHQLIQNNRTTIQLSIETNIRTSDLFSVMCDRL
jgi:hypothetical protein